MIQDLNLKESANDDLFKSITEKLGDSSFIAHAIKSSKPLSEDPAHNENWKAVTNEMRPDKEVRITNDLFHVDGSQHDRNTERMGEWVKNYEDTYDQGLHKTGKTNAYSKQNWQHLENGWDQMAPVNQPNHTFI